MRYISPAVLMLLAACSPTLTGANEAGGAIGDYSAGEKRAFKMADEHCAKFGKVARIQSQSDWLSNAATFACVPRQ